MGKERKVLRRSFGLNLGRVMPTVALSAGFVRQAVCSPGRRKTDYFDSGQRGFMLEVRCSGGKTYYQRYTDDRGRERQ